MNRSRLLTLMIMIVMATHILAPVAAAHPLGNFTINHYAGLHFEQDTVTVDFVLDMAEIPAFQEIAVFDANGNDHPDPSETAGYHAAKCQTLQPYLSLQLDGRPLELKLTTSGVEFPPGAGGLPTLRLSCNFSASLPAGQKEAHLQFNNHLYPERLGWREIVVTGEGVVLPEDSPITSGSISRRLTAYPDDLLAHPPDQRLISLKLLSTDPLAQQASSSTAAVQQSTTAPLAERNDGFTQLIMLEHLTLPTLLLALAVAFGWGAAHALTPGHGKTIVAAYLVGSRGTVRHALFLGLTTTITHTAGVFLLGFLTLFASRYVLPEQLYPWLGVISGVLVVGIGLSLFQGRLRGLARSGGEDHHHDHHHHDDHHHHHSFDNHTHTHLPPGAGDAPVTWRSLLALGISGGLIPCPSALIVMLSAIALERIGFGLILIVAFSLGLAGVLTLIGVVWVQARRLFEYVPRQSRWLEHLSGRRRWLQALPAGSALFITIVGIGITLQALVQTGFFS